MFLNVRNRGAVFFSWCCWNSARVRTQITPMWHECETARIEEQMFTDVLAFKHRCIRCATVHDALIERWDVTVFFSELHSYDGVYFCVCSCVCMCVNTYLNSHLIIFNSAYACVYVYLCFSMGVCVLVRAFVHVVRVLIHVCGSFSSRASKET